MSQDKWSNPRTTIISCTTLWHTGSGYINFIPYPIHQRFLTVPNLTLAAPRSPTCYCPSISISIATLTITFLDNCSLLYRKVDQLLTDWGWSAPQIDIPLTFDKFLRYCSEAEKHPITSTTSSTSKTAAAANNNNGSTTAATSSSHPLHYMTISAGEGCLSIRPSHLLTAYLTLHSYYYHPLKTTFTLSSFTLLFRSCHTLDRRFTALLHRHPFFLHRRPGGVQGYQLSIWDERCHRGYSLRWQCNTTIHFISYPPTAIHPIDYHIDNH